MADLKMTETEFNDRVDETLENIDASIEEATDAIDTEMTAGILTLTFENGTQVIINRQAAAQELWVAARSGGFHFRFDPATETWRNTRDGGELYQLLSRVVSEQAGTPLIVRA